MSIIEDMLPPGVPEKSRAAGILKDRGDCILDRVEGITDTSGEPVKLYIGNLEEGKPIGMTSEAEDGTPVITSMEGGGGGEEVRLVHVGKINTSTGIITYDEAFTLDVSKEIAKECGNKLIESKYPNIKLIVDFDASHMVLNPAYYRQYNTAKYVSFVGGYHTTSPYLVILELSSGGQRNVTFKQMAVV